MSTACLFLPGFWRPATPYTLTPETLHIIHNALTLLCKSSCSARWDTKSSQCFCHKGPQVLPADDLFGLCSRNRQQLCKALVGRGLLCASPKPCLPWALMLLEAAPLPCSTCKARLRRRHSSPIPTPEGDAHCPLAACSLLSSYS